MEWPNGSKTAVLVTLNLDAGLFARAYHADADPLDHDYSTMGRIGLQTGLPRVLDVLEANGMKATAFIPGWVAETYPEAVRLLVDRGHEVACRGYAQENLGLLSIHEQEALIAKGQAAVARASGVEPKGFRAPFGEFTLETLKIVKRLGFAYSSSLSDDDIPYFNNLGDGASLLEIPCFWSLYDLPYFIFCFFPPIPLGQGRISNYDKVLNNWKWEYDGAHRDGSCYVLQLDPTTAGDPGRTYMLEELFAYIRGKGGAWFATGEEMSAFMRQNQ